MGAELTGPGGLPGAPELRLTFLLSKKSSLHSGLAGLQRIHALGAGGRIPAATPSGPDSLRSGAALVAPTVLPTLTFDVAALSVEGFF